MTVADDSYTIWTTSVHLSFQSLMTIYAHNVSLSKKLNSAYTKCADLYPLNIELSWGWNRFTSHRFL